MLSCAYATIFLHLEFCVHDEKSLKIVIRNSITNTNYMFIEYSNAPLATESNKLIPKFFICWEFHRKKMVSHKSQNLNWNVWNTISLLRSSFYCSSWILYNANVKETNDLNILVPLPLRLPWKQNTLWFPFYLSDRRQSTWEYAYLSFGNPDIRTINRCSIKNESQISLLAFEFNFLHAHLHSLLYA